MKEKEEGGGEREEKKKKLVGQCGLIEKNYMSC